ncbi:MAG TPA: DUF305 domain-containing protein [Solirubrobacteraceae bacterium]|nr:DUF305 domain-containing protein [Solirubrobacteraceae bacterium]
MNRIVHPIRTLALVAALVLSLGALAACGGDDTQANGIDRYFAEQMIPHHQGAVDMAEMALERAEHPELRELAEQIITTQKAEIAQLQAALDDELAGVEAQSMGMSMEQMGMGMDHGMLRSAQQFDQAFIDMMIPHHEGGVVMSDVELQRGENPEMRGLARQITAAQQREIAQMREWRTAWAQEG